MSYEANQVIIKMKNTIKQVLLRVINSQFTIRNILKIVAITLVLKFLHNYLQNLSEYESISQSSLFFFLLPFRMASKSVLFMGKMIWKTIGFTMKFHNSRSRALWLLSNFYKAGKYTPFVRKFDWLRLLGFKTGEVVATFLFSVLLFIILLVLAGLWDYVNQEHLTKIGLIFAYLPLDSIPDFF